MESDQNRLTFHFKDEAEAVKAFEVLKKQGLTLKGLVDGMDIDALQAYRRLLMPYHWLLWTSSTNI